MSTSRATSPKALPSSKSRRKGAARGENAASSDSAGRSQRAKRQPSASGDASNRRFDAAYFRRYYFDPATRVTEPREMQRRANLIAAVLAAAQLPVRSILDMGCGTGLLRSAFARVLPRASYVGMESSGYLCRRYGWLRGAVQTFTLQRPVDLLVCYDVLQYLSDAEAARALDNFAALTRSALHFSALTRKDWREHCDRTLTDGRVHLRGGDWYRRRLAKNFDYLGFGVWVRRGVSVIAWELERCAAAS